MEAKVVDPRQRSGLSSWRHRQGLFLVMTDICILAVFALLWFPPPPAHPVVGLALLMLTRWQIGLYRVRFNCSALDELPRALLATFLAAGLFSVVTLVPGTTVGSNDLLMVVTAGVLLGVMRGPIYAALRHLRRRDLAHQRLILVGRGVVADEVSDVALGNADYGLELVSQMPDLRDTDLVEAAATAQANVVLAAFSRTPESEEVFQIRRGLAAGLQIMAIPRYFDLIDSRHVDDMLFGFPVLRLSGSRRPLARRTKRAVDVLLAGAGLAIVAPFLAVIAAPLKRETGAGLLFRQERIGKDGKPFELLKLQTMKPVAESTSNTAWTVASTSSRIGPVGKFLRKTSLDELPQLWNILWGDMSFVGPRPERPHFVEQFSKQYRHYDDRHRMTAGLTGLAQIYDLRGDTSINDRARFDNRYADHWSLWGDTKIALKTVPKVLKGAGS